MPCRPPLFSFHLLGKFSSKLYPVPPDPSRRPHINFYYRKKPSAGASRAGDRSSEKGPRRGAHLHPKPSNLG
eukprot:6089665-Prymnesium_polylepis.1